MDSRRAATRERLVAAGLELYRELGHFDFTAAQIAHRAGLTERTFFRYFSDKRDLLFAGGTAMEDLASRAVHAAAPAPAFDLAVAGLVAVVPVFAERLEMVVERQRIIAAHDELKERDLSKRNRFSMAITHALVEVGIEQAEAELVGAMSGVIFHDAFTRWLQEPGSDLAASIVDSVNAVGRIASSS